MFNYTSTLPTNPPNPPNPDPNPGNGNAPPPLTTGLPAPWHYAQCWVDNAHGRILSNEGLPPSTTMTPQTCINYCNSQGYVLAGLQYSQGLRYTKPLMSCFNALQNASVVTLSTMREPRQLAKLSATWRAPATLRASLVRGVSLLPR